MPPPVSIVTPAYREAGNLAALTERIFQTTRAAGIDAELIVVDDDSRDGTVEVAAALADRFRVRLVVRHDRRDLSSAVVEGFSHARFDRFLVIDADLQHPPESIPALLEKLDQGCEFVIGTRYAPGGRVVESWPAARRLISGVAGLLARPLTPLSDPMAGFFALDRTTYERAEKLNPIGYKIALELYVRCRCRRPGEVPITFDVRAAGESKLTITQQMRYLRQLVSLYRFRYPWAVVAALFAVVMGVAVIIGLAC